MKSAMHPRSGTRNALIWLAFACAAVLATAPVWRPLAFGFNPTLDQILSIVACKSLR